VLGDERDADVVARATAAQAEIADSHAHAIMRRCIYTAVGTALVTGCAAPFL